MSDMPKVIIYTDGACSGNPGPGGWGVYLQSGAHEKDLWGGEAMSTNQRMEMQAVVQALKALKKPSEVTLYSDSSYVLNGIQKWIVDWKKRGWKNSKKQDVANRDLWEEMDLQRQRHQMTWCWVKGHAGNVGNERADDLARRGVPTQV
ncbi:MAG: ribonuclease HI [Mariprofundaceae bacterium]|nr:ribonuclease HI [Mariprofundaceae bacterium]